MLMSGSRRLSNERRGERSLDSSRVCSGRVIMLGPIARGTSSIVAQLLFSRRTPIANWFYINSPRSVRRRWRSTTPCS